MPDAALSERQSGAFVGLSSLGVSRLAQQRRRAVQRRRGDPPADQATPDACVPIIQGKTADLDAAVDCYTATLLDAVRDAADQIASLQSTARQQRARPPRERLGKLLRPGAMQRFHRAGLATYLTVLSTEKQHARAALGSAPT